MKTKIYLAIVLALLSQTFIAQNAKVQFGRHGSCNTGRGICAIETTADRQAGNAKIIKQHGHIVLQILTDQLTDDEKSRLTESIINSPVGYLKIEAGFEFSPQLKSKLHALGSSISSLNPRNYSIEQLPGRVDIHLSKL